MSSAIEVTSAGMLVAACVVLALAARQLRRARSVLAEVREVQAGIDEVLSTNRDSEARLAEWTA